jgi:Peptidase family M50
MRLLVLTSVILCTILAWVAYMVVLPLGWNVYFAWIALILGAGLATFVHEVGHVLGAKAFGWRIVVFAVGRLAIRIPSLRFGIVTRDVRDEQAGWVVAVPPNSLRATKTAEIWFIVGGPMANFMVAFVLFALALPRALQQPNAPSFAVGILIGIAWQMLATALANAIPNFPRGRPNDGAKLVELLKAEERSSGFGPTVWLQGMLSSNIRLNEIPKWVLDESRSLIGPNLAFAAYLSTVEIGRELDGFQPDISKIDAMIAIHRRDFGDSHWLSAITAFVCAVYKRDAQSARKALAGSSGPSTVPQLTLAAEAAIEMLEGRYADAERKLKEALATVRKMSPFRNETYEDIAVQVRGLGVIAPA